MNFSSDRITHELVTPFSADGSLDETALAQLARFHARRAGALMLNSEIGEVLSMTASERCRAAEIVVEAAQNRVPVAVQVTAFSTREAQQLSRHARSTGASAVVIGAPFYWQLDEQSLERHVLEVSEAARLPVVIATAATSLFPLSLLVTLAKRLPNLMGILQRNSSCIYHVEATRRLRAVRPDVWLAVEADALPSASLFGNALGMSALGGVMPGFLEGLAAAAARLELEKLCSLQFRAARISRMLARHPGAVKFAMSLLGRNVGTPRQPLGPISPQLQQAVQSELERTGCLATEHKGW